MYELQGPPPGLFLLKFAEVSPGICGQTPESPNATEQVNCRGPAPAGSRGTLRMNGVGEREARRTSLDRAKSAREREREKETRPGICSRVWQLLYFSP